VLGNLGDARWRDPIAGQSPQSRNLTTFAVPSTAEREGCRETNGECHRRRAFPVLTNEWIASLLVGVMASFIFALAWGHQISDLIVALD
jgi:hypothetical protein